MYFCGMNQGEAGECRDSPILPPPPSALVGKRLSLTDLFCQERFALPTPESSTAGPSQPFLRRAVAAHPQHQQQRTPHGFLISSTNPFLTDLLVEEELQQPYLYDQFIWKHGLQPKYQVVNYLSYHPVVTSAMRSELIGWLSKMTGEFKYDIETFLLAVNFVDRFLAVTFAVAADQLQLLGSAALLVAAKKEETNQLEVKDLVDLNGHVYSAQLISGMEIWLLQTLNFQLCAPTAAYFFDYFMTFIREPNRMMNSSFSGIRNVFHQLLKSRLVHYELIHYAPSTVAAAALCLCQRFLPNQISVEPLSWLVDVQELTDIQRCYFEMSVWHAQSPLCWTIAAAATSAQQLPGTGNNATNAAVEFYHSFANFSIAHPQ